MFGSQDIKKKIFSKGLGIALGGGGLRGFFHIGVLKALEEDQIPIAYIAGTSIGSLIGGLFAAGFTSQEILEILEEHTESLMALIEIATPTLVSKKNKGFFNGENLIIEINKLVAHKKIEELPIPFVCRAVDLMNFKEVIFDHGDLGSAIKGSCSIPGLFTPNTQTEKNKDSMIVDGGVTGSVPIAVLKSRFKGVCLACNLFSYENMSVNQISKFTVSFNDTRPFKILPFTDPMIRSFYMNQSHIAKLEYELYKPELSVEYDSCNIPSILNIKKIKQRMIINGYIQTKNLLKKL
ncbi:MAG: patatin-like phospholipase family protein [Brevinema sp.]